jgi:hypothetical protein
LQSSANDEPEFNPADVFNEELLDPTTVA